MVAMASMGRGISKHILFNAGAERCSKKPKGETFTVFVQLLRKFQIFVEIESNQTDSIRFDKNSEFRPSRKD